MAVELHLEWSSVLSVEWLCLVSVIVEHPSCEGLALSTAQLMGGLHRGCVQSLLGLKKPVYWKLLTRTKNLHLWDFRSGSMNWSALFSLCACSVKSFIILKITGYSPAVNYISFKSSLTPGKCDNSGSIPDISTSSKVWFSSVFLSQAAGLTWNWVIYRIQKRYPRGFGAGIVTGVCSRAHGNLSWDSTWAVGVGGFTAVEAFKRQIKHFNWTEQ